MSNLWIIGIIFAGIIIYHVVRSKMGLGMDMSGVESDRDREGLHFMDNNESRESADWGESDSRND